MKIVSHALLLGLLFALIHPLSAEEPSWLDDWHSPPMELRPLQIVHGWFSQSPDLDKAAARLKNCGLGGIVCSHVNGPNYFRSEDHWKKFVDSVKAAKSVGLRIWLCDEDGYPSLAAGGVVLDGHPELEAQALVYDKESAEPFFIRPAYEFTHAANNYHAIRRYPNPLDVAATRRFIDVTHAQYRTRLGRELFDQVEAFWTEEPSMMAFHVGQVPEEILVNVPTVDPIDPNIKPLPMVSWTSDLPERYWEKYGEDLLPQRKSLFVGDSAENKRIRRQFWSLLGELVKERFYGQIEDWCRDAGGSVPTLQNPNAPLRLTTTGHTLFEEYTLFHVPIDGNKLQVLARMSLPGLDELNSDPMLPFYGGWRATAFPSSAAMLTGKRLVQTEISDFIQKFMDKKPAELSMMQAASAAQFAWGITEFALYYGIEDRSEEIHRQYCDFVGRVNAVLRRAKPCRPVLLYYPIETLQEEYIPTAEMYSMEAQSETARKAVDSFERLGGHLTQTQVPFILIDSEFLAKTEFKNGELEIAGNRFHTLVLPDVELPKSVAERVETLRKKGFRILIDQRDAITIPNVPKLEPANNKIVLGHFQRDNNEIFLLMNADKENVYEGRLKNVVGTTGFILDPQTGDKIPLETEIRLAPYQTLLYVFR